ncbi:glutamate racemase [Persephonella hydrogeniphila]|uniref:Glutamate racemase n=1 Tax=Persephonella hydrogeniphila TaxID=198703 RepID=A0A285MZQ9_9AQUI|nr:glutamate racemase [Persephonella hydrogeniphila]SNZ02672.1 glutamate racemase [Persephonella hydrogeniphila]
MSIGIFDSGIGGLTVFKEISREFPQADIYYLGDTARVPYGNKSKETVIRYSIEAANYLRSFGIDALIIACNTASSYALDTLKESLDIPVIGVVEPGVETALRYTENKKVGVIGTSATIRSNSYRFLLEKENIEVFQKACPLFVPLVEEGIVDGEIAELIIKEYLEELVKKGIDTLILGCTHYPLLKKTIEKIYPHLKIVDSSQAITDFLHRENLYFEGTGKRKIYITDESENFERFKNILVGDNIPLEKIELSKLCTL